MSVPLPNLYRTGCKLRWGVVNNGVITFEPMLLAGGRFLECTTTAPLIPMFSVEKMGRYPTSEEYSAFSSRY